VADGNWIDVLGDVARHDALTLRVGEDHRHRLCELVHCNATPRAPCAALAGLGAAR